MEYARRSGLSILERLNHLPAVVILGPRQVGKTTLARAIGDQRHGLYLDMESPLDREVLAQPHLFFAAHQDDLVILDEVQRVPDLFAWLRGVIDEGRRSGKANGRFLLLGSASNDLLQQSETLAGRVAYVELTPLNLLEIPATQMNRLWLRGGFPESFKASTDEASLAWRRDFIRTYLERDIPQLGPRIPATTLYRFWTMLAHVQGGLFNAAQLARGLAVDGKTIARYLDLMSDLMLVRRLQPYQANIGKRLVKSPKVYVRDSGLVHALLGIGSLDALLGHPVVGTSWEGFVIENLLAAAPPDTVPMFYRTAIGLELDLILEIPKHGRWAFEIKRSLSSKVEDSFFRACDDVQPSRSFLVNAGKDRRPIGGSAESLGLLPMMQLLANLD